MIKINSARIADFKVGQEKIMRAKLIAYSVVVAIAVLIPIAGHAEAGSEDQAQEILERIKRLKAIPIGYD